MGKVRFKKLLKHKVLVQKKYNICENNHFYLTKLEWGVSFGTNPVCKELNWIQIIV